MNKAPELIYLQWAGTDCESTWCSDQINDEDIEYVRYDSLEWQTILDDLSSNYDKLYARKLMIEKTAQEAEALAASRLELLRRCKEEMEISLRDFDKSINPWLEAAGYHPVTLTPRAMKKLISELAEELAQAQADEYIESEDAHIILEVDNE